MKLRQDGSAAIVPHRWCDQQHYPPAEEMAAAKQLACKHTRGERFTNDCFDASNLCNDSQDTAVLRKGGQASDL